MLIFYTTQCCSITGKFITQQPYIARLGVTFQESSDISYKIWTKGHTYLEDYTSLSHKQGRYNKSLILLALGLLPRRAECEARHNRPTFPLDLSQVSSVKRSNFAKFLV